MAPNFSDIDWEIERKKHADRFPGALYGEPSDVSQVTLAALESALQVGSEEAIQVAMTAHPYLLKYAMSKPGHHGTWAFPKQMIRPRGADGSSGMIPDFLVVTLNSLGYFWHVVELKRANVQFGNADGTGYSTDAHSGLAQCNGYLTHMQDYIDAVRANIRVPDLLQPEGAILLIGDSTLETPAQRECRMNFVRNNKRIDVVTYRRILGSLQSHLHT